MSWSMHWWMLLTVTMAPDRVDLLHHGGSGVGRVYFKDMGSRIASLRVARVS